MKTLYKYLLIILRLIPSTLAIITILADIFLYFEIDLWILNVLGGVSIIPLGFIFIASYTFQFCKYHRIPLYYVLFNMVISIITTIWKVPISDLCYLLISIIAFGIIMILALISRYKVCKNKF